MSIKLISQVLDSSLPSTEKFVAVIYADHANDEGEHIYPSIAKTAKRTSLDPRTVQRATRALEDRGILVYVGEKSNKRTNEYRMIPENLPNDMTLAHDHPQTKVTHDPGTRSPMTLAHDHHDPGTRSPMTLAHDHPNHHIEPSIKPSLETSGGNNNPFDFQYFNGAETAVNGNGKHAPQPANQSRQNSNEVEFASARVAPPQPNPEKPKTKKRKTADPLTINLSPSHNTPQMTELITKFIESRQAGKRPITQNALDLLISQLETVTIPECIARLTRAIVGGWQGVFFPNDEGQYAQYRNGNGGVNGYYAQPKNGRFGGADTNNFDANGNFIMPGSY